MTCKFSFLFFASTLETSSGLILHLHYTVNSNFYSKSFIPLTLYSQKLCPLGLISNSHLSEVGDVVHQTSLASGPIMTSCVVPKATDSPTPIMLLHGFDRSGSLEI